MSAALGSGSDAGNSQVALESEQPLAWGHHYLYDLSTEHLSPFVKMCPLSLRPQGPPPPPPAAHCWAHIRGRRPALCTVMNKKD